MLHKFQEAIVFSSWGFLLLGSPMLVAYGLQAGAPWYYFALLLPFMAGVHLHSRRAGGDLCACCSCIAWRAVRRQFVALA